MLRQQQYHNQQQQQQQLRADARTATKLLGAFCVQSRSVQTLGFRSDGNRQDELETIIRLLPRPFVYFRARAILNFACVCGRKRTCADLRRLKKF